MTKEEEEKRLNFLVEDLERQKQKKEAARRRRMHVDDKDVNFINDKNRNFNTKLERDYSKYTQELKSNFERGSAI